MELKSRSDRPREPTRSFSSKQERRVAEALGGRVQPNSGATDFRKGDVEAGSFLVECKTRERPSKSITLRREWFDKLRDEALFEGKRHTALAFSFGDGESWYAVSEDVFKRVLELLDGR